MDDYDNDFEEIEDLVPSSVSRRTKPLSKINNQYGYQSKEPTKIQPRSTSVQKKDSDDYGEYEDDFEADSKAKSKPTNNITSNTKPLEVNNKPDWLKSSNQPAKPVNVITTKPTIGTGANSNLNNYSSSKPTINNAKISNRADTLSENRQSNARNITLNNQNSLSTNLKSSEPAKQSSSMSKPPKKQRDFSVEEPIPKPKKINLPKDYLDKYIKNNPVRDLEKSLKSIKENIKKLEAELADSKSIQNEHKRQKTLQRVNKDLRTELKKLSESSTILCDELQKKHYKKKKTPRKLDGEVEIKIKDREIENADKQMNNLLSEYNAVKKRIEQVGDYNYAVELKAKVQENEQKIKENEKLIKEMEQDQKRRDIQMNRMVKEEKTEKMRKVDYKHSKLTYLQEKINELNKKIETLQAVKEEQDKQETEVKQKYDAMLRIGEHYGITEKNIDNEEQIFKNQLLDDYQQLSRKEKLLQQEIDSIEKQFKVELKEKKKLIKELTDKKKKASQDIGQTVKDILTKAKQLDELIEKMRGFGMGEDILNTVNYLNCKHINIFVYINLNFDF